MADIRDEGAAGGKIGAPKSWVMAGTMGAEGDGIGWVSMGGEVRKVVLPAQGRAKAAMDEQERGAIGSDAGKRAEELEIATGGSDAGASCIEWKGGERRGRRRELVQETARHCVDMVDVLD